MIRALQNRLLFEMQLTILFVEPTSQLVICHFLFRNFLYNGIYFYELRYFYINLLDSRVQDSDTFNIHSRNFTGNVSNNLRSLYRDHVRVSKHNTKSPVAAHTVSCAPPAQSPSVTPPRMNGAEITRVK